MVDFVKLLLENGASVESELIKVSAIHLAVRNLHSEIVDLLLQHQANVSPNLYLNKIKF
jgi:ankyrin repeat protein